MFNYKLFNIQIQLLHVIYYLIEKLVEVVTYSYYLV